MTRERIGQRLGTLRVGVWARIGSSWPALLAVGLPFAVLLAHELVHRQQYALGGDQALIELDVRSAASGHQLLGPYSRFGWRHPGPTWYYLLALPYRLLGERSWALVFAVVLISGLAALGVVGVAGRLGGRWIAMGAALLVLMLMRQVGFGLFRVIWNPVAEILPTLLFLLLVVAWMLGRRGAGWAAALVGSAMVQTHVGTGVIVAAELGSAVVLRLAVAVTARGRRPFRLRRPSRHSVVLGGVLVLVWLAPLIEQLTARRGNLRSLGSFAVQHAERLSWGTAARHVSRALAVPFGGRVGLESSEPAAGAGWLLTVAAAALLLLVAGAVLREGAAVCAALVTLIALVAAVQTVRQTVGPIYGYLTVWMVVLPLVPAVGLLLLLRHAVLRIVPSLPPHFAGSRLRWPALRSTAVGAAAAGIGLAAMLLGSDAARNVWGPEGSPGIALLRSRVLAAVSELPRQEILVRDVAGQRWPQEAGIVLALRQRGIPATVPRSSVGLFGQRYLTAGRATATVDLIPPIPRPIQPDSRGQGELFGCVLKGAPPTCLYIAPAPPRVPEVVTPQRSR